MLRLESVKLKRSVLDGVWSVGVWWIVKRIIRLDVIVVMENMIFIM